MLDSHPHEAGVSGVPQRGHCDCPPVCTVARGGEFHCVSHDCAHMAKGTMTCMHALALDYAMICMTYAPGTQPGGGAGRG